MIDGDTIVVDVEPSPDLIEREEDDSGFIVRSFCQGFTNNHADPGMTSWNIDWVSGCGYCAPARNIKYVSIELIEAKE